MIIHDITLTIRPGMPTWPGDPAVERSLISSMEAGDLADVSRLTMCVHTGSHVDAPVHFIPGGSCIDSVPLQTLIGPCLVREVRPEADTISERDLEALALPANTQRLLLKTRNSRLWRESPHSFVPHYVALDLSAARWLVRSGVKLVGVDYLSVEPLGVKQPDVHRTLLAGGVVPVPAVRRAIARTHQPMVRACFSCGISSPCAQAKRIRSDDNRRGDRSRIRADKRHGADRRG